MDFPEKYTPSGRGPEVITTYSFFIGLATIVVALRVYVRLFLVKSFGVDDYSAVLGWALFAIYGALSIAAAAHGTGQHFWLIPIPDIALALKYWSIGVPIYIASNMAVKLSIGLTLLRFVVEDSQRIVIWATLAVIEVYSFAFFFVACFQCRPFAFFYTRVLGDTNGTCLSAQVTTGLFYAYSAITCANDWIFAILPWFMVRKLQMDRKTKIMVTGVLAVGSIASAATIIRIPFISGYGNKLDFLYTSTNVSIWSCIETGLSICASSAAMLKPLFREVFGIGRSKGSARSDLVSPGSGQDRFSRNNRKYIKSSSTDGSINGDSDERSFGLGDINVTKTVHVSVNRV